MYSISYVWISLLWADVSPPRTLANVPRWKGLETIGLYTHDSTRLKTIEITSSRLKTIQNDWSTAPSLSFSIVSYRFFLEGTLFAVFSCEFFFRCFVFKADGPLFTMHNVGMFLRETLNFTSHTNTTRTRTVTSHI